MNYDNILKQISSKLEAGIILFTGAGFSMSTKDYDGINLPSGAQLAKEIWPIAFPNTPYDDYSKLSDVFYAAKQKNEGKLKYLLQNRLSVNYSSIPDWYELYLNFPWYKVYTLNLDNIWESMAQRFKIERKLNSFSSTTDIDPTNLKKFKDNINSLSIIHINGMLKDIPNNIIFSEEDYGTALGKEHPTYSIMISEFACKSFIFIGSQLEESLLWKHICLRTPKGRTREFRELRPESFLVIPTLSRARQQLLNQYNVSWIPMATEEFSTEILIKLKDKADQILKQKYIIDNSNHEVIQIPDVSQLISKSSDPISKYKKRFLLGNAPTWHDIVNNKTIERDFEDEYLKYFEDEIINSSLLNYIPHLYTIVGTAGDGKSATGMRLAAALSTKGHKVGWINEDSEIYYYDIRSMLSNTPDLSILFIDSIDIFGIDIITIIRDLLNEKKLKLCVFIIRATKIENFFSNQYLGTIKNIELPTTRLSDNEIRKLISILKTENLLGILTKKNIEEQVEAFKKRSDRQLIVAMIEATSGDDFSKIICSEYKELEEKEKIIYCLIAVTSSIRQNLYKNDILLALEDSSIEVLNYIERLIKRGLLIEINSSFHLRHRVIAQTIIQDLTLEGILIHYYFFLAKMCAIKKMDFSFRDRSRIDRLLRHCINHARILEITNSNHQDYYNKLEQYLTDDYHFWLQRGCLELEIGDVSFAQNYLGHASSINSIDPFVINACAYLDLKMAYTYPTNTDLKKKAEDAIEILKNQIKYRGEKDSYPYHILGSQGIAYCNKCIPLKDEKKVFYKMLLDNVEDGFRKHPKSDEIKKLRDDIKKQYLLLAVNN